MQKLLIHVILWLIDTCSSERLATPFSLLRARTHPGYSFASELFANRSSVHCSVVSALQPDSFSMSQNKCTVCRNCCGLNRSSYWRGHAWRLHSYEGTRPTYIPGQNETAVCCNRCGWNCGGYQHDQEWRLQNNEGMLLYMVVNCKYKGLIKAQMCTQSCGVAVIHARFPPMRMAMQISSVGCRCCSFVSHIYAAPNSPSSESCLN